MSLHNKPLEAIEESDLQALADDQVPESRTVDYKEHLPDDTYDGKKEFLADVSSFANAAGGHMIFGIKEEAGVPVELSGLQISNADAEILRLDNMVRDGIEPRVSGIGIRPVRLQDQKFAIVMRIPRSFALPHVVNFRKHWRFYSRNSAGKYPLDVLEVRAAFALSENITERIRNFHAGRLSKITAEETPVVLHEYPKVALHIIPFGAFDPTINLDLSPLARDVEQGNIAPRTLYTLAGRYRHNLDGFLLYGESPRSAKADTYLQVFRNGSIEVVDSYLLRPRDGRRIIPSVRYEEGLLEAIPRFLAIQRQLGVEPPLFVMLSLLGVSGYTLTPRGAHLWEDEVVYIDRDTLLIPEVVLDSFNFDASKVMKPIFDAVWNAAGWPRSVNYDNSGNWRGRQ